MNIGIDARFVQGLNTGVTNYLINLIKCISKIDKENTYTNFLSDANYKNRIPNEKNFHIKENNLNAFLWKNLWLPKEIKRLKINVMHFPAYTVSLMHIDNTIVTIPDVIHKVNPAWFSHRERILLNLPIEFAIRRASHIIAFSENTKQDIIKYYAVNENKITITFLAADETFKPIKDISIKNYIKNKYSLDTDFILNVGVLFKRRNIERLLEAFSMLKRDKTIEHKLVIIGPGKAYFNLSALIEKYGIRDEVIYLGYVQQDDMPLLYNAASFFVYPSLYEGFGLPVLEAMSCGKAVITSNVSSLPEVLGDSGILIDPYNAEVLRDAMFLLIKDRELREEFESRALRRARIFSWNNTAEQTVKIYEKFNH